MQLKYSGLSLSLLLAGICLSSCVYLDKRPLKHKSLDLITIDQPLFFSETQYERDILAAHLSRLLNVMPYVPQLGEGDEFLYINYPGCAIKMSDITFFDAPYIETVIDERSYLFSHLFNRVFVCDTTARRLANTTLEDLLSDANPVVSSMEHNANFYFTKPYPLDTANLWRRINYKNNLNIKLVSEGRRLGNIQFPKDSLSAEIAILDLERGRLDYTVTVKLGNWQKYAVATRLILMKNAYMEIYDHEPRIHDNDNATYTISQGTIMKGFRQEPGVSIVGYVCSIFHDTSR